MLSRARSQASAPWSSAARKVERTATLSGASIRVRLHRRFARARLAIPHMDHGDIVGIEPLPSLDVIEHLGGGAVGAQQRGVDPVLFEQPRQIIELLDLDRLEEVHHELLAIEFGAAVDENRNVARDK